LHRGRNAGDWASHSQRKYCSYAFEGWHRMTEAKGKKVWECRRAPWK
jgi:hypothetical protein